jgi:hypothetical protein
MWSSQGRCVVAGALASPPSGVGHCPYTVGALIGQPAPLSAEPRSMSLSSQSSRLHNLVVCRHRLSRCADHEGRAHILRGAAGRPTADADCGVVLAKWSRSPVAIGDGRSRPCSHNGERTKANTCGRTQVACDAGHGPYRRRNGSFHKYCLSWRGLGGRPAERYKSQPDNQTTPHAANGEKLHLTSYQVFHEPLLAAPRSGATARTQVTRAQQGTNLCPLVRGHHTDFLERLSVVARPRDPEVEGWPGQAGPRHREAKWFKSMESTLRKRRDVEINPGKQCD